VSVKDQWVTVGWGKDLPRVSMTAPLLSAARQVIILVAGAAKRQALERLLDPREDPARTPAKLVAPRGEVLVLCNRLSPQRIPRRAPNFAPASGQCLGTVPTQCCLFHGCRAEASDFCRACFWP